MTSLYEGNNINWKMTLRIQLKDVKMQMSGNIQSYFSNINKQLEAVKENVEEVDIVITTLNGLPISWDSFIQGTSARRK